ncbi:MAG: RluA family pseudouridine synthase [Proteobacteria bacterium]|nr:RluA family pseudouridine synthase [Pseudomonadota bacterium]
MPNTPEETITIVVEPSAKGGRLDKVLADAVPHLSRGRIQKLLDAGHIRRGDASGSPTIENATHKVKPGDIYVITVPEARDADPEGEDIPLTILYEDSDIIVIDKPAGLVVHPAPGHYEGTLVNALLAHCGESLSGVGGVRRPGIVHRLDKDTSGVMIAAKNDLAHGSLSEQFATHSIERVYHALCWSAPRPRAGTVDAPLGRSSSNRKKQAVVTNGRRAVTLYKVEKAYGPPAEPVASLIECRLETGRTHQIRVHMTHIGHSVIGDPLYGRGRRVRGLTPEARCILDAFGRQALHAGLLGILHPRSGAPLTFTSDLPPDLNTLLQVLEAHPTT